MYRVIGLWTFLFLLFPAASAFASFDWLLGVDQGSITEELNKELKEKVFASPIAPNCLLSWSKGMERPGLSYGLCTWLFAYGVHFSNAEEAIQYHAKVLKFYLDKINAIRRLRPFLAEFPLTPATFRCTVTFKDLRGKTFAPPLIASSKVGNGKVTILHLLTLPPSLLNKPSSPWKPIYENWLEKEPALQPLFTPTLPASTGVRTVHVPEVTALSRIDRVPPNHRAQFDFVRKFSRHHGLKIVTLGCVGKTQSDRRALNFGLRGNQRLSLEEAKKLAGRCCSESFRLLQQDPSCLACVKFHKPCLAEHLESASILMEQISFRMSFWDEIMDRQPAPYIAEIRLLDGALGYFCADEYQRLQLVHQESFDEAVRHAG